MNEDLDAKTPADPPTAPTGRALRNALLEALPKMTHEGFGILQATAIQGSDELEAIVDVGAEAYLSALEMLSARRRTR
jgi:hypothetical protein